MNGSTSGRNLLRQVTLRNVLSYGPDIRPIDLQSLNVIIGPNGSGKSNLIEVVGLIRSARSDMRPVIRRGQNTRCSSWTVRTR
jgi:predicted ATPase